MYRKIMRYLEAWKDSVHRKPLILQGARPVSYTHLHHAAKLHVGRRLDDGHRLPHGRAGSNDILRDHDSVAVRELMAHQQAALAVILGLFAVEAAQPEPAGALWSRLQGDPAVYRRGVVFGPVSYTHLDVYKRQWSHRQPTPVLHSLLKII